MPSSVSWMRYPLTKRAARPRERSTAINSRAESRQLPLPSWSVSSGVQIPASSRITYLILWLTRRLSSTTNGTVLPSLGSPARNLSNRGPTAAEPGRKAESLASRNGARSRVVSLAVRKRRVGRGLVDKKVERIHGPDVDAELNENIEPGYALPLLERNPRDVISRRILLPANRAGLLDAKPVRLDLGLGVVRGP